MNFINRFNSNIYIQICNYLIKEVQEIQKFISTALSHDQISNLRQLDEIYNSIFNNPITNGDITLIIERVINPYYIRQTKPTYGNSSYFISIKLSSDTIQSLDKLYDQQLTIILRLYKNIFTIVDCPQYRIKDEINKYINLIQSFEIQYSQFIKSNFKKSLIEKRKKLKSEIIKNFPFAGFYHMTHIDNLEDILTYGLLSHKEVHNRKLLKKDISNEKIQQQRNRLENVFKRNIQDYVPLYINHINPMFNSRKVQKDQNDIVILEIIPHILIQESKTLFSDGNAAQMETNFYNNIENLNLVNWELLQKGEWNNETESYRIMCSEVLIPDSIKLEFINKIIIKTDNRLADIVKLFPNHKGIQVEINHSFFQNK